MVRRLCTQPAGSPANAYQQLAMEERELLSQLGRAWFCPYTEPMCPRTLRSRCVFLMGVVARYEYNGTVAPAFTTFFRPVQSLSTPMLENPNGIFPHDGVSRRSPWIWPHRLTLSLPTTLSAATRVSPVCEQQPRSSGPGL